MGGEGTRVGGQGTRVGGEGTKVGGQGAPGWVGRGGDQGGWEGRGPGWVGGEGTTGMPAGWREDVMAGWGRGPQIRERDTGGRRDAAE